MDIKNVTTTTRLKWFTHIVSLQLTAIITGFVISTLFDRKLTSFMTWHQILCPMGDGFRVTIARLDADVSPTITGGIFRAGLRLELKLILLVCVAVFIGGITFTLHSSLPLFRWLTSFWHLALPLCDHVRSVIFQDGFPNIEKCAVFMLQGILLFGPNQPLTFGYKRIEVWNIHAIIAGLGTVCMSLGTIFAIVAKSTHFTSLHGILGLTSWIVCLLATILGILVKFKVLKSLLRPIIFKFIHVLLGLIGFILSVIVNSLGFYKGYGRRPGPEAAVITMVSLGGAFVCIISTRTLFARTQGLLNSN